jgi:hypothetical protein
MRILFVVWLLAACACESTGSNSRWHGPTGQPVPNGRLQVDGEYPLTVDLQSGPAHCDSQDVQLLDLVWPLGQVVTRYTDAVRQYVWDPDWVHHFDLLGTPLRDATPPSDAHKTGYSRGRVRLWVADTDADRYVYLQQSDGTFQRWPRATRPIVCS